ncbi:hypothetical protein LB505_010982 [Fusarium chuoi]|nr:hypothetical protein LB505_010982 [Fusarium chuoi]
MLLWLDLDLTSLNRFPLRASPIATLTIASLLLLYSSPPAFFFFNLYPSLLVLVLRKRYSNRRLGTLYDFYLDIQSVTAAFTPLYLSRGLRIEPGLQHKPFVRPYLKPQSAKRLHESDYLILLKDCFSTSHRSMTVP